MASQVTKIARIGAIQSVKAKLKLNEFEPQGENKCHCAHKLQNLFDFCFSAQNLEMTLMRTIGIGRKHRLAVARRHCPCQKSCQCGLRTAWCHCLLQEKF